VIISSKPSEDLAILLKKSIKGRLTLYVVVPVMITLLTIGGIGFNAAYNEAQEIYDSDLSHVAGLMLSLLHAEDEEESHHAHDEDAVKKTVDPDIIELGNDFDHTGQQQDRQLAFRIWKNNQLLFYSKKATDFGDKHATGGFSNQFIVGKEWRLYVLVDRKDGYTLEVAQNLMVRKELISKVLTTIFFPLILLLPIILIVTWVGLRAGLKPLITLSQAVKSRSSLDLTPLPGYHTLTEITPLISSINGLLSNLSYALKKERRFTDLAAHELRTPIAIFKTQAQTALKSTDDMERQMIMEAQVKAADRATNMVDQLLTLARLEHADIPTEPLSLSLIIQETIEERIPLAKEKQIDLHIEEDAVPIIQVNKELFALSLSNLVGNAIKYTPAGGEVIVRISEQGRTVILSVCDTGPGVPEKKLPYITERFYRISNRKEQGTGLGLAIVKRAAEIMGATLILRNRDEGGFESTLQFSVGA